jgi:hypothetical protein
LLVFLRSRAARQSDLIDAVELTTNEVNHACCVRICVLPYR